MSVLVIAEHDNLNLKTFSLNAINAEHIANLDPLSDIRASREYRFHAAQELIKRTLIGCQKIEDNYAN